MDGFDMGGVMPVVKHMPGHGRATMDSHMNCRALTATATRCGKVILNPLLLNDALLGMTGHLLFTVMRAANMFQNRDGDIIRNHIGFDGVLMSDDISMSAAVDMGTRPAR